MIIVIDGPAGSGKSSTAKAVAQKMSIAYLDSGALYRALTWLYLGADQDKDMFFDTLKEASISFSYMDSVFRVRVNEADITDQLRTRKVSDLVSTVASDAQVRSFVNDLMHRAIARGQYIAEGRDLGTSVFPEAALKFYMIADEEERARRRFKERKAAGEVITMDQVRKNIQSRDQQDENRKADPLKKAPDAIEIDTTAMNFDQQVQRICSLIDQKTELTYKQ